MAYRLDELARLAAELGFGCTRPDPSRVDVRLTPDTVICFLNLIGEEHVEGDHTLVGFEGTPWHTHGTLEFLEGTAAAVACDELEVLVGLATGELVVVSRYRHGALDDRWLEHTREPLALEHMAPGEELRVMRLWTVGRAPT